MKTSNQQVFRLETISLTWMQKLHPNIEITFWIHFVEYEYIALSIPIFLITFSYRYFKMIKKKKINVRSCPDTLTKYLL